MDILVDNWSLGLWTAGPAGKNPARTLTRMVNVQVMDEGTIATRPGCSLYAALAGTQDGAYMSSLHFFKDAAGNIYQDTTPLGFTQTGRRLRIAGMACFGITEDITFFPVCMKKYHNNTVSNWGITMFPAAPTAADAAVAGNLTGNYQYIVAYYNSNTGAMGDLSQPTNTVNITSSQITLSKLPGASTDPQVNQLRIYRTTGGITGTYYLLDTIPVNTTTYNDNISDVGLGDLLDNNFIAPPTANIAAKYKSSMLLADLVNGPRFIYPSLSSFPESFDSTYYEMVADAGDTVEALVELGDYAYVFGRNNIYLFQLAASSGGAGNLPTIYIAKVATGRGTVNGRTVCMGTSGIYMAADDGVYVISGFTPVKISDNIDALFRGNDRGGLSLISDYDTMAASFVGGRYYLSYFGIDGLWHTVVFNENKGRWKNTTGWHYTVPPTSGSQPLVGLANNIGVFAWNTTTDVGEAFTSLCGFNLPGIPPTTLVDFRSYRMSIQCSGTVQVDIYDSGVLKWSAEPLVGPTFGDAYIKHDVTLGEYFVQPEIVISSSSAFTLKAFEAHVDPVRKQVYDYTRSTLQQAATNG